MYPGLTSSKYREERALRGGKNLLELQDLDILHGSLGRKAIQGILAFCSHLIHTLSSMAVQI